jgi:hypothetical protein
MLTPKKGKVLSKVLNQSNTESNPNKLQEVEVKPTSTYTGPLSKMKAKQAIRKGEADTAFSVKNKMSGKRSVTEYRSSGNNKPEFMSKRVTSEKYRKEKGGSI